MTNRILENDIRKLIDKINRLDPDNVWTYDYYPISGGYYISKNRDNPIIWTNSRLLPKETYAFLNGVLYTLKK